MPEGDTLHRHAARIGPVVVGRKVLAFSARTIPDAITSTVVGHTVTAVEARGKNLLVRFDDGRSLHVHLRMLGRLYVRKARGRTARPTTQLTTGSASFVLEVLGATIIGTRVPVVKLLRAGGEARDEALSKLGPDLAAEVWTDASEQAAIEALRAMRLRPIGEALLVQRALSGIGNVYKSEVLFLEKIDPTIAVGALDDATLAAIVRRARKLLRLNVGLQGPRRTRSSLAGPRLWVYERAGKPCLVCGTEIVRIVQGIRTGVGHSPGRSTYHCPRCQRDQRATNARPTRDQSR